MKRLAFALLLLAFAACEKKPSEEEIDALVEAKAVEKVKATATPTPKPEDWRIKGYQNPLEKRPAKR